MSQAFSGPKYESTIYTVSCGGFYIGGKGAVSIGGAQCVAPIPLLLLVYKKRTATGAARCRSDTAPFAPLYKPPQVSMHCTGCSLMLPLCDYISMVAASNVFVLHHRVRSYLLSQTSGIGNDEPVLKKDQASADRMFRFHSTDTDKEVSLYCHEHSR